MNAMIAIQDLIKTNEKRIKILKAQLDDNEAGRVKLSVLASASAENALEQSQTALDKNRLIYDELLKHDMQELEKEERIKEAITRKNYYKYQKLRIKRNNNKDETQKLEAMMIVDELPTEMNLNDEDIFDIASTTIQLDLRIHDELDEQLNTIKKDFEELLKNIKHEDIDKLGMLQIHIPIVVLHLAILVSNIEENIKESNLPPFKGLPMYEDWWIDELWFNHQAYFGLFKWKSIVSSLCITDDQKKAWESIFSNWIFIKKVLNKKGNLAFEFNFAFDSLMKHHTNLEEELNLKNLKTMETIVQNITQKEDFHTFKNKHNIETPYFEFKKRKLNYKDEDEDTK